MQNLTDTNCTTIVSDTVIVEKIDDPNMAAYEKFKSDPEWFEKYKDQYVAFIDGEFFDSDINRDDLLNRLHTPENYEKQRFFAKVEKTLRIIDEPTSLWLDII